MLQRGRSRIRSGRVVLIVGLLAKGGWAGSDVGHWRDEFKSDPFGIWSFDAGPGDGFGDNSYDQFQWDEEAGALVVHYDSSLPTVRFERDLPRTYSEADAFMFSAQLRLESIEAPDEDFMQISFALTNSETTGAHRTGTFPIIDSNTFDNVELAYYPNVSELFGGPFMTVTVQGTQQDSPNAFDHLSFGTLETELPLEQILDVRANFDPRTRTIFYRIGDDLEASANIDESDFGEPAAAFTVDRFSINTYFDGADFTPETISLLATVAFDVVEFSVLGDADFDGDTDLIDFGQFQVCFDADKERFEELECGHFDFDGDGVIDLEDFATFSLLDSTP